MKQDFLLPPLSGFWHSDLVKYTKSPHYQLVLPYVLFRLYTSDPQPWLHIRITWKAFKIHTPRPNPRPKWGRSEILTSVILLKLPKWLHYASETESYWSLLGVSKLFFIKRQINILGFVGHMVSVTTTHFYPCNAKAATDNRQTNM